MAASHEELYAPFRPARARRTAWTAAVVVLAVLIVLAAVLPGSGPVAFRWYDRLGVAGVGAAVAWFLSRFARLEAVPGEGGLRVRNLFVVTQVTWPQIVDVRFGGGGPWVVLDLSDGETLPVMAVQRADGDRGAAEARRMATLVALNSRTPRDD